LLTTIFSHVKDQQEVVENDLEVQVEYLCEGPLKNGDNSHINVTP